MCYVHVLYIAAKMQKVMNGVEAMQEPYTFVCVLYMYMYSTFKAVFLKGYIHKVVNAIYGHFCSHLVNQSSHISFHIRTNERKRE